MWMIYELRKTESSWTNSLYVGRLQPGATSFPAPNRNASQVQLLSVSSLFRRANNRNQIRIPERLLLSVSLSTDQPVANFLFYNDRPNFVQSSNYTAIADVRSSVPSTNGLSLRVIELSAEGKSVTLMDQNVYFHPDAPGLLDDGEWERGTRPRRQNVVVTTPSDLIRTTRTLTTISPLYAVPTV